MFYTTRHQTYCRSDTDDMVFASPLIRYHTHKKNTNRAHTGTKRLTQKYTGWPTKMSLFFFGNNFYKNKEIFKIFSPVTGSL